MNGRHKMKIAVYSGSFDPVTKGHQDIIAKVSQMVDKLIVLVIGNSNKKGWFNFEERKELLATVLGDIPNVEIRSYDGLLVDFMREEGATVIVRGLRAVSDFEYELMYAFNNHDLSDGKVNTIFVPASRQYMYLSSSGVREAALCGARLDLFVDEKIIDKIKERAKEHSK